MFGKLTDTASIIKAKITKDDLEEKLVSATSEENWQTSTNILHEIANAAYNYEKWQKINDFIWEKLKKKSTWRKVLKTLHLVQFLLKNGPPSIISSFKYDIYQFRTYSDYQQYSEGVDRGESIREKAKQIVQLLSNDQMLEEQREKAKTIRQKMSGVVGGIGYGGYSTMSSNDSKYQSYDSKSYSGKGTGNKSFGDNNYGGMGVYGDYTYNKSTLDKYKNNEKNGNKSQNGSVFQSNKPSIIPDSTGASTQDGKKPFEKIAPKLVKPQSKKQAPKPAKVSVEPQSKNILDDDIIGAGQIQQSSPQLPSQPTPPPQQTPQQKNIGFSFDFNTSQPAVQAPVANQPPQSSIGSESLYGNQPQPGNQGQAGQNPGFNVWGAQQTPQQNMGMYQGAGMSHQPQTAVYHQQQQQMPGNYHQFGGYNQHQVQQGNQHMNYGHQQMGNQQMNYGHQQAVNRQGYQQPYQPNQSNGQGAQISLSSDPVKPQDDGFGNFQSGGSQGGPNVKWLSNEEKGLIDFSDFGNEINNSKNMTPQPKKEQSNNIQIDAWNW